MIKLLFFFTRSWKFYNSISLFFIYDAPNYLLPRKRTNKVWSLLFVGNSWRGVGKKEEDNKKRNSNGDGKSSKSGGIGGEGGKFFPSQQRAYVGLLPSFFLCVCVSSVCVCASFCVRVCLCVWQWARRESDLHETFTEPHGAARCRTVPLTVPHGAADGAATVKTADFDTISINIANPEG